MNKVTNTYIYIKIATATYIIFNKMLFTLHLFNTFYLTFDKMVQSDIFVEKKANAAFPCQRKRDFNIRIPKKSSMNKKKKTITFY